MGLRRLDDKFHHDQGSDSNDLVKVCALDDLLLQRGGDNALLAVGAVIGHNDKLITAGAELVLQNDQILVAETDDAGDLGALLVQCLGNGQRNGAAHAAADDADVFQTLDLGGLAQGSHSAGFAVKSGDGQGDALGVLLCADNDKLAGLCLLGNERRVDAKFGYGGVQLPPFDDSKQSYLCFSLFL